MVPYVDAFLVKIIPPPVMDRLIMIVKEHKMVYNPKFISAIDEDDYVFLVSW